MIFRFAILITFVKMMIHIFRTGIPPAPPLGINDARGITLDAHGDKPTYTVRSNFVSMSLLIPRGGAGGGSQL